MSSQPNGGGESQTRPAADAGRTVKGRVTDESGAPVIGATVILKGTTIGTATNAMGEYAIDIRQADAVLVYSLIGYRWRSPRARRRPTLR